MNLLALNYKMRLLTIYFLVIFLLTNCSDQESKSIHEDLKNFAKKHQTFIIKNTKSDTIMTKNGIGLLISQNSFRFKDGRIVDDSIQIEVIEVFTKSDMLFNGVSTTSQGRLIESIGMIKITAQSNGQELFIRDSSSVFLGMPNKREIIEGELFYGKEENEKFVDWEYAGGRDTTVVSESDGMDAIPGPPKYFEFELKNLGWINCDRFVEIKEKAELRVELKNYSQPVGYLVFNSINSVMSLAFDEKGIALIKNLPNDYEVHLFIIDKVKGKLMFAKQTFRIEKAKSIQVEPKQIDAVDLKGEIERLDK